MRDDNINVEVAKSLDDLMKVMVIRGAVFMGEQHHSYNVEFGESEFTRTHLLAHDKDEPVGTMRILKDNKDAKFERLAILASHRGKSVSKHIIDKGYELCKESGIERICLFCKPNLLPFWEKQGYKRVGNNQLMKVGDIVLMPIVKNLTASADTKENDNSIPSLLQHEEGGVWVRESNSDTIAIILNKKKTFTK